MYAQRLVSPLIILGALLTLRPGDARGQGAAPNPAPPAVVTTGTGAVTLAPQRAVVRIGVSSHAASAAEASAHNATLLRAVLDTLVRAGFPRESLQTLTFGVGPNYDYANGRKLIDYAASSAIRVSLNDLNRVGRVIDMALGAGATEVAGIDFDSDSTDAARHRALAQAFAKAHEDAKAVAAAAGGSLGRLLELTTQDQDYSGYGMALAASGPMLESQVPVLPRDVTVRVSVQARWAFVPSRP